MSKEKFVRYDWHSRINFVNHPKMCESHDDIRIMGSGAVICPRCLAVISNEPIFDDIDLAQFSEHLWTQRYPHGKRFREWAQGDVRKSRMKEYTNSSDWHELREVIIERDGGQCRVCGNKGTQAHHRSYKRVGKENLLDLTLLCDSCHKYISDHRDEFPVEMS